MEKFGFGNFVSKPSNFLALLEIRQRVASFEDQSHFVGENFKAVEMAMKSVKE